MPHPSRRRGVPVDGMLLLDKPAGDSSNHALQHVRRLLNARKAGHTGSLDPIATGLLPLCFGQATRICGLFLAADKSYRVQIRLGITTETGDREGEVLRRAQVDFTQAQLDQALDKFRGPQQQIPPMYSALKQDGQPLYKLARAGVTVEREPRSVTVYELTLHEWDGDLLDLHLKCSRGFYVRTLAADLGDALGCGGHVSALRRTEVGAFHLDQAITAGQLEDLSSPTERRRFLMPTDRALSHLGSVTLPENIAGYLRRGQAVRAEPGGESGAVSYAPPTMDADGVADRPHDDAEDSELSADELVRVYTNREFLGLAQITADGRLVPKRLFG